MTTIRPGPPAVLPNLAPGGVVVQVYDEFGVCLLERRLRTTADADRGTVDAQEAVTRLRPGAPVALVCYDGDTGERITPLGTGPYDIESGRAVDE